MIEPYHDHTLFIATSPAHLWDVLTKPELTREYMFGCETVSDWQVGKPLLWRAGETVYVKGNIVKLEPKKLLVYTVFDPQSTLPDVPENYLTVTYELAAEGQGTRLHVTQGDYTRVANGEERYGSRQGWEPILVKIKEVAERQG